MGLGNKNHNILLKVYIFHFVEILEQQILSVFSSETMKGFSPNTTFPLARTRPQINATLQ